ncbi:NTP transferase domain-containing protein, partial [Salmonella sp. SAL4432]|uniref:nucleotidyltransferase family protein n=1 Tax=Salmonella sp. SAL4432 TaxID=3159887 RepID=UPI00397D8FE6
PVVRAAYEGRPGHPVLLDRAMWPEIERLEGDAGARDVLRAHPEWVAEVEIGGDAPEDVDTPEDWERLLGSEA